MSSMLTVILSVILSEIFSDFKTSISEEERFANFLFISASLPLATVTDCFLNSLRGLKYIVMPSFAALS